MRSWVVKLVCLIIGGAFVFSCHAQTVVVGTKNTAWIGGQYTQPHQLVIYDLQTGAAEIFYNGNPGENMDAVSFLVDANLALSGRTSIDVAGNTYHPRHIANFDWNSATSSQYYSGAPNDVAAVHIIDSTSFLVAFKVDTQFGGQQYRVGDVLLYDLQTDMASLYFSSDSFYTIEDGGTYAVGNIDALAMTYAGNLLISTTNTAEIGSDAQSAFKLFQEGVYEVEVASGVVQEFFDPNLISGVGADLKAFSLVPQPLPDEDNDGVAVWSDSCPGTPQGASVDQNGCALSQLDSDGDGVTDDIDQCPDTPAGEAVDSSGCAWSQYDEDEDGVNNGSDHCPDTPPGEFVNLVGCPKALYPIPLLGFMGKIMLGLAFLTIFFAAARAIPRIRH